MKKIKQLDSYKKIRKTWGNIKPIERIKESKKLYKNKKERLIDYKGDYE